MPTNSPELITQLVGVNKVYGVTPGRETPTGPPAASAVPEFYILGHISRTPPQAENYLLVRRLELEKENALVIELCTSSYLFSCGPVLFALL